MSDRDSGLLEAKVEAAFDRYTRAVLSGLDPTPALFIDSLEAEGLRLSYSAPSPYANGAGDRRVAERRAASIPVGRRADGLLSGRLRGLF